jgi:hypothetical protein
MYFPRTRDEETASAAATAGEQLDEFGDVLLGRNVSIGRMPSETAALADGSRGDEGAAGEVNDWSQTLLRYVCRWAVFARACVGVVTRRTRSHARC